MREHAHDLTTHLLRGFGAEERDEAIEALRTADGAIAVTPIFTTSYSGLFKSFLDILDPQALTGLPVLLAATGGTERHSGHRSGRVGSATDGRRAREKRYDT